MQSVPALSGHTLVDSKLFIHFKLRIILLFITSFICWERSRQGTAFFRMHHMSQVAPGLVLSIGRGCVTQGHPGETHTLNKNLSGSR